MSIERRTKLLDGLMEGQPGLRQIVTNRASLLEGNWDLTAFAHQQGFEALWDHAVTRPAGLAVLPLLMLWHQSCQSASKRDPLSACNRDPLLRFGMDVTSAPLARVGA